MVDSKDTISGIDLADQLVQDLRETYGAIWLFMPRVVALIERLRTAEREWERFGAELMAVIALRDELEAKLTAADKRYDDLWLECDKLGKLVAAAKDERDDLQRIFSDAAAVVRRQDVELAQLREQVERLTAELATHEESWKVHEVCHLETTQLRKQVERLTAERDVLLRPMRT